MDPQVVWQQLLDLQERGLVRLLAEDDRRTIRFKHALVQEATYSSILTSRRTELHRDVAQAIQELGPNRDPIMSLTAAEHWYKAHDYARMLSELLPRSQELIFGGHGAALLQLLDNLTPKEFANAGQLNEIGRTLYHLSAFARSLEFNRASLAIAERTGDLVLQAKSASGVGLALWNLSDFANAEVFLERSRELSVRTGEESTLANVEFNLSNVLRDRGDYTNAIAAADHALQLFIKLGNKMSIANTHLILGTCYYSAGDSERAASYYSLALDTSREMGDVRGLAVGLCNLAELEETLGRYDEARAHFEEALDKAELLMNDYLLSFARGGLGHVQMLQGHLDDAMKNAEAAREIAARMNSKERLGAAYRVIAEIHVARGDESLALEEARRAVELLDQVGHALELKRANDVYSHLNGAAAGPGSPGLEFQVRREIEMDTTSLLVVIVVLVAVGLVILYLFRTGGAKPPGGVTEPEANTFVFYPADEAGGSPLVNRRVSIVAPDQTAGGQARKLMVDALPLPPEPAEPPPKEKGIDRLLISVIHPRVRYADTLETLTDFDPPLTLTFSYTAADAAASGQVDGKPRLAIVTFYQENDVWRWERLQTDVEEKAMTCTALLKTLTPLDPVGMGMP